MVEMRGVLPVSFLALAMCAVASAASALPTYQTLYSFAGASDGANPQSGLVMDAAGNLYGTTPQGGASNLGTLFKLAPDGTFTLLHTFKGGRDGAAPTGAALTLGARGTIYGMTVNGGLANGGTVYRFRNGEMKVLHSFGLGNDGYWPSSGLLPQPDGSLVGITNAGGGSGCSSSHGCGTIFRLAPDGTETILHAFAGGTGDGSGPVGTPVRDLAGNLFGTTYYGGQVNKGAVYRIATDGAASLLYSFINPATYPNQGLAIDKRGNLFGTTQQYLGAYTGAVFKIDTQSQESIVLDFSKGPGNGTGNVGLLPDKGELYGTLTKGGGNQTGDCNFAGGCGAFFVIDPKRQQITVLHGFGGSDGLYPSAGVITDGRGNYYGTTSSGGAAGNGTIFKISMGFK
jgi:uncharacterized repeat protein (TIGR03803 family)